MSLGGQKHIEQPMQNQQTLHLCENVSFLEMVKNDKNDMFADRTASWADPHLSQTDSLLSCTNSHLSSTELHPR